VECRETDQIVHCRRCDEVATFANLGTVLCPACGHENLVRLPSVSDLDSIACEKCRTGLSGLRSSVRVYPLGAYLEKKNGEPEGLHYCGLNHFNGYYSEVSIAQTALDRVASTSRRMFGLLPPKPKKAMFVHLVDYPRRSNVRELPVSRLRYVHAYCNFSIANGHQSAKLLGLVEFFAAGTAFRLFVQEYGLVNIWFGDAELMREIQALPSVAPYVKRFGVAN
jgi:hypothetical protein